MNGVFLKRCFPTNKHTHSPAAPFVWMFGAKEIKQCANLQASSLELKCFQTCGLGFSPTAVYLWRGPSSGRTAAQKCAPPVK